MCGSKNVIHIQLILFRRPQGKIEWMMAVAGGKYAKMPLCASLNCSLCTVHCVSTVSYAHL